MLFRSPAGVARRAGLLSFREVPAGAALVAQGDRTTELLIVLAGEVEVVQARPGRDTFFAPSLGVGSWFGEASAHSHHPALATYRAKTAVRVAALEARLFSKLYAEDEEWKNRIDAGYQQQLALHLRASSLCRELDEPSLQRLQQQAELRTIEDGEIGRAHV